MIIRKITIENFRSYYGSVTFEISEGLNLIIGSNGDGKSTFFDALAWLLNNDGKKIEDPKHISKKRIAELMPGESDDVKVTMEYEHLGQPRLLEKSFRFSKAIDNSISVSNPAFYLYKSTASGKDFVAGAAYERDFPAQVRQYSLFTGEEKLNVLKSSDSLKVLIELFSDVKGFDPYIAFMEDAVSKAFNAANIARTKDRTNAKKTTDLIRSIKTEEELIAEMEKELRDKEKTSTDLSEMLKNIENSKEASELLIATNKRIDALKSRKANLYGQIKENYTTRLLDDMWILMGFEPIAKEFTNKVHQLGKEKRRQEKDFNQQLGARKLATQIELGFVPLAVNVPDKKTMEELLEDEVCKVCGRPAKKGSDAWNFMKHKLEDYLLSLRVDSDDDESKFCRQYIEELSKRDTTLNDNMSDQVTSVLLKIETSIDKNESLHDDIALVDENIEQAEEQKNRILASNEGMTEDDLNSAYQNITHMVEEKAKADRRIAVLKRSIPDHKEIKEELMNTLRSISKDSVAATLENTYDILSLIKQAFIDAKRKNKEILLTQIEDLANVYLELLNINDFKGRIRICEPTPETAIAKLVDIDKMEVANPNTALRTTQYMAILFAISKLAEEKGETEYPLLFDAPTSSFDDAKESEFFNVFSQLKKQVIIVTKSFLKDAKNGVSILDVNKINEVDARVYYIELKRPFNREDLSTLQTVNSKIK